MVGRGFPYMIFHLYDAEGGFADIPANYWLKRSQLYKIISDAVVKGNISVNNKTAKKIGISES
jgi:hypothetical protein